jgi:hypothetical protein
MLKFKEYITEKIVDTRDAISFDIPLLIRVLELTREKIKSDSDLHKMVERLIKIRNKGTLTMNDYRLITKLREEYKDELNQLIIENGMAGVTAAAAVGPTNVVGGGAIAGTGGAGGEPGVSRKKKVRKLILMSVTRKSPV